MWRVLEVPSAARQVEFLSAVARSRRLHQGLVGPPKTPESFKAYLERCTSPTHMSYWVVTETGELAGVVHVSEIVRGVFQSAHLGYYAFEPHQSKGYMTRGVRAVVKEAFRTLKLHRLEANIQPGNTPSVALVRRLGFRLEGYSPRYLKVSGRWRDHERWALTVEEWSGVGVLS